ncbi:biotin/lipoyl-containing protein, partial [Arthrobacter sp. 35/47]|uniref:biotin/lipoyl-containing protein n=1 Tax=Arthrobacter sp. 35/47 TaxID=269454 RepID=UPI0012EC8860
AAAAVVLSGAAPAGAVSSRREAASPWHSGDGWRVGGAHAAMPVHLAVGNGPARTVLVLRNGAHSHGTHSVVDVDGRRFEVSWLWGSGETEPLRAVVDGVSLAARLTRAGSTLWLTDAGWSQPVRLLAREEVLEAQLSSIARSEGAADPEVRSPMPGTVITVKVSDGDLVEEGQVLLSVEAMKMEHQLTAAVTGTVAISLSPGDLVSANQVVARIHPQPSDGAEDPAAAGSIPPEQEEPA